MKRRSFSGNNTMEWFQTMDGVYGVRISLMQREQTYAETWCAILSIGVSQSVLPRPSTRKP
jgi:hypothetical protein